MSLVANLAEWLSLKTCLVILSLCSYLKGTYAIHTNTTDPPYRVIELGQYHGSGENVEISKDSILPVSSKHPYAQMQTQTINPVDIVWLNSSTDSISFQWDIANKYTMLGYIRESVVEYLQEDGKFTSSPLDPSVKVYTFHNLDADTAYIICAYMVEVYGEANESSITHSRCLKIKTIEYIRRDSVIVVMVTLGYYLFMCALGYTQWKRRCWEVEKRNRAKEAGSRSTVDKYAMRWKDLEQREKLMNKPGCSIEANDT